MKIFLLSLIFIGSAPLISFAHGLPTSQIQPAGEYLVEFEYDGSINVAASEFNIYYVYLLDQNQTPVEFDSVYIKLSKPNGSTALFATVQESEIKGSSRIGGILDEPGEYTAHVLVQKEGRVIGPVFYKFRVNQTLGSLASENPGTMNYIYGGAVGLIIGTLIGIRLKKKS